MKVNTTHPLRIPHESTTAQTSKTNQNFPYENILIFFYSIQITDRSNPLLQYPFIHRALHTAAHTLAI